MFGIRKLAVTVVASALFALGVVGCEPQHPQEIPSGASLVAAGDKDVIFTAPSRGMVYIYDDNGHRLEWSGEVDQGKTIMVDKRHDNRVLVDGNLVANKLNAFHNEQIYFQPMSGMGLINPTPAPVVQQPQPQPAVVQQPQYQGSGNGLTVTPSLSVSPANQGQQQQGSVTLSPTLSVSPATQPTTPTQP